MASLDLSTVDGTETVRNETLGTAGNVRIVILPLQGKYTLSIVPRATACKLITDAELTSVGIAENGAIGSAKYMTIPLAGAVLDVPLAERYATTRRYGIASTNSSEVVEIYLAKVT
jgi:hypothetical protein